LTNAGGIIPVVSLSCFHAGRCGRQFNIADWPRSFYYFPRIRLRNRAIRTV
jgi:hypothetical protein